MQELLKNAWQSWQTYNDAGKYVALLIVVLLFFWFRKEEEKEKLLLLYTTFMTFGCILPISAVVLMKYQTGFYGYEWIWNYVPIVLMIAYGVTVFLTKQWECYKKENMTKAVGNSSKHTAKKALPWRCLGITALVVAVIIMCGRMGQPVFEAEADKQEKETAKVVLEYITEGAKEQEICLWAPKEMMASARAIRGDICLIYGRNIWDASLGSYFYEAYTKTEESLYLWMCNAEATGSFVYLMEDGTSLDGIGCVQIAVSSGVNRILLPGTMQYSDIAQMEQALGVKAESIEGYYLFVL